VFACTLSLRPERAEPLYNLADHFHKQNQDSIAFMFALRAAQLPYPKHCVLWVHQDVYKWQAKYLVGLTALHPTVMHGFSLMLMFTTPCLYGNTSHVDT